MSLEVRDHRQVARAGVLGLPIVRHPLLHQRLVERALAAQHQVDARCLVEEFGLREVASHLRFQPPDQARQQRIAQACR